MKNWPHPEYPLALVGDTIEYIKPLNDLAVGALATINDVSEYDHIVWRIDISITQMLALATELSEVLCKGIPTEEGLDFDQFSIDDTNSSIIPMFVKKSMREVNNILFAVNKNLSISAEYDRDPYDIITIGLLPINTGGDTIYVDSASNWLYYAVGPGVINDFGIDTVRLPNNLLPTGKIIHYIITPTSQAGAIQDVRQSIMSYYINSLLKDFYALKPAAQQMLPIFMAFIEDAKQGIGLVKSKPYLGTARLNSRWP